LPETEKPPLRERLKQQSHWTTQEIQQLIKDEFLVEYSLRQVSRLLREMNLYFYKPFQLDEKRPLEAEEMLTQSLLEAFQKLQAKGVDLTRVAIGFGDECSPQTAPNTARFWSVFKQPRKVLTTKIRRNTFGFYTLRGNDCIFEIESSKAVQFVDVLSVIKEQNPEFDYIILIWDNLRSHKSEIVLNQAEQLNIILVNLPKYSPDLNPIEYVWKTVKRAISQSNEVKDKESLANIIDSTFQTVTKKLSFARNWIQSIFNPVYNSFF
jgi:transposase